MSIHRAVLAVTATIVAALPIASTAQPASARVVQTIGAGGPHPLRMSWQVAVGPGGAIYVVDIGDRGNAPSFMHVYTTGGALVRRWRIAGVTGSDAHAMAVDQAGNVYVAAIGSDAVLKFSPTGQLLMRLGPFAGGPPGQFAGPVGVGVDPSGTIVVQNARFSRIETFAPDGRRLATWPYVDTRSTVSVGASGAVYDANRQTIAKLDPAGALVARIPTPPQLGSRPGAFVEGPGGTLYTGTSGRLAKLGADGTFQGSVGTIGSSAAVAGDGGIYVAGAEPAHGTRPTAVLRLAPITEIDETRPSLSIDRFSLVRRPRSALVRGRLRYALSEDASVQVTLTRRAKTTNPRNTRFGEFLFMGRRDLAAVTAGSHVLRLDWRRLGSGAHLPPGVFRVSLVARDDAGNESHPARVTFRVRR